MTTQLDVEEALAWQEYLDQTRHCPEGSYPEVEPWAWSQLRLKLATIEAKRQVREPVLHSDY